MKYRVDNVPLPWRPFWLLYGYVLGLLMMIGFTFLRLTVRFKIEGGERLKTGQPYIFVMWHRENLPAFVVAFFRITGREMILINHPSWYMLPIHLVLYFLGVKKLIMGSAGHGGRAAADALVPYLKAGFSTYINPDGPAGPPLVMKKGALHLAAQSGLPLVPARFVCDHEIVNRLSWDGKRLPLPFTKVVLRYGEPMRIRPDALEESVERLSAALSTC